MAGRGHGVGEGRSSRWCCPRSRPTSPPTSPLAKLGASPRASLRLAAAGRAAVLDRLRPDVVLDAITARSAVAADGEPPCSQMTPSGSPSDRVHVRLDGGAEGSGVPRAPARAINVELDAGSLDVPVGHRLAAAGVDAAPPRRLHDQAAVVPAPRLHAAAPGPLAGGQHAQARRRAPRASLGGVAAQIGLLLRVPDFDTFDVSCVQGLVIGAGASPAAVVREARERFGAGYSIRYSSTESGGVGTATAFDADDDEIHTCGLPRPGVEIRIDPDNDEVLLRSAAVMAGYWRDPELTATTLDADGWLRTGDLGELDDNGCLRLVGRTTDMYIRGGYNVHPQEVEAVLLEHPAVADVAMVPRADPVMGEIGVAVVVVAAGQPSQRLTRYARSPQSGWRRTSCPRRSASSPSCPSRRWTSSTGAPSPTSRLLGPAAGRRRRAGRWRRRALRRR